MDLGKKSIATLLIITILALSSSCLSGKKGKGGSRQPRKGPIPCPIKDC